MRTKTELEVTLSDDLLGHLSRLSRETHTPLPWLVAGLVCDTIETLQANGANPPQASPQSLSFLR